MARYEGQYSETFTVDVPIDQAEAHFSNLETIAKNYGGVKAWKKVKNDTLKLTLEPRTEIGVTFNGEHSCRWTFVADHVLEWKSVGKGNMWSQGTATFKAAGKKKTQIEYTEHIECEMEVNFLLARLIGPIVARQIRDGVRDYLQRMRASLKKA
jgi:carbon monoxide dehydrogenase subunit G